MRDMIENPPLKIALHGLDAPSSEAFGMFIAGPARGCCQIVEDGSHEVALVDLDGLGADRTWIDLRRRFLGPALVLSVRERKLHNGIWVPKPLRGEVFIAAVEQARGLLAPLPERVDPMATAPAAPTVTLRARNESLPAEYEGTTRAAGLALQERRVQECCGHMDDATYLDPAQRAALFYAPDDYFQGVLIRALEEARAAGSPAVIEGLGHGIYLCPDTQMIVTAMREQYLRPLCVRPMATQPMTIRALPKIELPPAEQTDPRLRRLESVIWKVALWSARGRVVEGTSLTAPVSLRAWPNLPRLMAVPYSMQIAALWAHRPMGLLATAEQLTIPCRYVFAFHSACQSLGLIESLDEPQDAEGGDEELPVTARRGLLQRLLDRLGLMH